MRTFADDLGREWQIKITAPAIDDMRKAFDVDLASWDRPPFERLAADPELLVNVLFALIKSQADQQGVTARQFGEAMGDAIGAAAVALMEATTDFFPPSKQSSRRSLLEKTASVEARAMELALAKLDDPRIQDRIQAAVARRMDESLNDLAGTASRPSSVNPGSMSGSASAGSLPAETPTLKRYG